jgi:hypothetical protein
VTTVRPVCTVSESGTASVSNRRDFEDIARDLADWSESFARNEEWLLIFIFNSLMAMAEPPDKT